MTSAGPAAGLARIVRLDHLTHLSTPTGLFEHALGSEPRHEHGMCVDDVARALVVVCREPATAVVTTLRTTFTRFLMEAHVESGLFHNRRSPQGEWLDVPSQHDHWGRAVWALAIASESEQDPVVEDRIHRILQRSIRVRSPHSRAMAYAALGAARLLRSSRSTARIAAQVFLSDFSATRVPFAGKAADDWQWPEPRLSYANAVLPEALIAVGSALRHTALLRQGLADLAWLVRVQTHAGHLSMVPAGGRGPGAWSPKFDQQAIEVATLVEAADTAWNVTGDPAWQAVIELGVGWFEGHNDSGLAMRVEESGAGFDGLEKAGVNTNQGAESTLAWLATAQAHTRALAGTS